MEVKKFKYRRERAKRRGREGWRGKNGERRRMQDWKGKEREKEREKRKDESDREENKESRKERERKGEGERFCRGAPKQALEDRSPSCREYSHAQYLGVNRDYLPLNFQFYHWFLGICDLWISVLEENLRSAAKFRPTRFAVERFSYAERTFLLKYLKI